MCRQTVLGRITITQVRAIKRATKRCKVKNHGNKTAFDYNNNFSFLNLDDPEGIQIRENCIREQINGEFKAIMHHES